MIAIPEITLAGHPFLPTGQGIHFRESFRAVRAAGLPARVLDIYEMPCSDPDLERELSDRATRLGAGINIFHINADEVSAGLDRLKDKGAGRGYNILYPAWELAKFPRAWLPELERFDEVWTLSSFIYESLAAQLKRPVHNMTSASEARISSFLGRRYFGIPESSFCFLFMFDFTSYLERKNPFAALQAFERIGRERPYDDIHFVIKLNGAKNRPADHARFEEMTRPYRDRMTVINRVLRDNEIRNLVRCCDCFLSLHRAEGYGHALAEAMFLGKPLIATGYSGNMDFTRPDNSLLVDFDLVPVPPGAYPQSEGQVWAEPKVDHAVEHMRRLLDDPEFRRETGRRASRFVRQHVSYRATGLRYLQRLTEIASEKARAPVKASA